MGRRDSVQLGTRQPKTIFGKRLHTLKVERNLTNEQIAELTGVPKDSISSWMLEYRFPNGFNLIQVSKGLDVSADWLLGLKEERK